MGNLIYSMITSLDGYISDERGRFDWAEPDEETHTFVNDLERPIGTYLYGRRMYEVMSYWGAEVDDTDQPPYVRDYTKIWRAADKIVFSTSSGSVSSGRTRIEPSFDADDIRRLKASTTHDISIGGPVIAAQAFAAGLIDEYRAFIAPVVVGGGARSLPDGMRLDLELTDEHRFGNGSIYVRYRVVATDEEER